MQRLHFRVQSCVLICMLVFTEVSRSYLREGSNTHMLLYFSPHHSSAVAEYYNKRLSSEYSGYDHFHLISCLFSWLMIKTLKCQKTYKYIFVYNNNNFSLLSFNSFSLSCVPAGDWPEPSEGETDESKDGQQVGKRGGVHRRDAERGAGVLHAWRPLQSPAFACVWLSGRGMITCIQCFATVNTKCWSRLYFGNNNF